MVRGMIEPLPRTPMSQRGSGGCDAGGAGLHLGRRNRQQTATLTGVRCAEAGARGVVPSCSSAAHIGSCPDMSVLSPRVSRPTVLGSSCESTQICLAIIELRVCLSEINERLKPQAARVPSVDYTYDDDAGNDIDNETDSTKREQRNPQSGPSMIFTKQATKK